MSIFNVSRNRKSKDRRKVRSVYGYVLSQGDYNYVFWLDKFAITGMF